MDQGSPGWRVPCWRHQGKGRRGAGCAAGHPGLLRCRVTSIFRATMSARLIASAFSTLRVRSSIRQRWCLHGAPATSTSSLSDTGIVPGYLRTHPVTVERIADARLRLPAANSAGPRKPAISTTLRALLRSYAGEPKTGGVPFESALEDPGKFASEAATRSWRRRRCCGPADFERASARSPHHWRRHACITR